MIALAVAIVVAAAGMGSSGALGNGTGVSPDDQQIAQALRKATGGAATEYAQGIRKLEDRLGISPGNGTITAAEVGPANYQALVDEIAAIGDKFDAVTTFQSDLYKLGIWAITVFAQIYDANPKTVPIATPIVFLFVAAALLFAPAVFLATGKTLFGPPDGLFPSIDGVVPFGERALQSFAGSSTPKDEGPLVSVADRQEIRDGLASAGLSGDELDLVARLVTLGVSLTIADARR